MAPFFRHNTTMRSWLPLLMAMALLSSTQETQRPVHARASTQVVAFAIIPRHVGRLDRFGGTDMQRSDSWRNSHRRLLSRQAPANGDVGGDDETGNSGVDVTSIDQRNVQSEALNGVASTAANSPADSTAACKGEISRAKWMMTLIIPLWLVFLSNQWSRHLLGYLVDFSPNANNAMNVEIGFTKSQYSVLASVTFTALYSLASLGGGAMADFVSRKFLTVASAVGWSVATLGTSLATTYQSLVFWRLFMGLTCAFAAPTAYTMINQNVPPHCVSLASSLYGTGVVFGTAVASLSILLDKSYGWRTTTQIVAAFGFASALIASVMVRDDAQEQQKQQQQQQLTTETVKPVSFQFVDNFRKVLSISRVRWILAAALFRFSAGLCIGIWSPPYFRLAFPDQVSNYAIIQAAITAIAGSLSGIIGGTIADRLASSQPGDPNGQRLLVPFVGSCLAAPLWWLVLQYRTNFGAAMIFLAMEYLVAECWFGPTISALQTTVGRKIGGAAQGCFALTAALANFAPALLGYSQRAVDLSHLLAGGVGICYALSAACFYMASREAAGVVKRRKLFAAVSG